MAPQALFTEGESVLGCGVWGGGCGHRATAQNQQCANAHLMRFCTFAFSNTCTHTLTHRQTRPLVVPLALTQAADTDALVPSRIAEIYLSKC